MKEVEEICPKDKSEWRNWLESNHKEKNAVWLGRIIIFGGIGYLISMVIRYAGIDFSFNKFLTLPATIGEFWMIGYLLIFGIRTSNE